MNILIICNCSTGLEIFRGMLIRELVKKGDSVKAIVPKSSDNKELEAEKRIKKMHCDIMHVPLDRRGINPLRDFKLLWMFFKIIKRTQPDLVITYTIKPNIYGGFVSKLLKIPYVVNITGLGTAFQSNGILHKMIVIMYKAALKQARIVLLENIENRDAIVESGIVSLSKTHVLAGAGVDLEYFHYLEYPKDDDTIRFLFIGRIMKEKGINELFEVMRRLKKEGINCELDVLGGFEEDYKEVIELYEREGWLHYKGYQNDVRPYIQRCHCFVLPSWHEGMANTNLENAASGRPLITSNIHGCLEAVIDGKTGFLVDRNNVDDLYAVMKKFTRISWENRKIMGIEGRKHMEDVFDKKRIVSETIERLQGE